MKKSIMLSTIFMIALAFSASDASAIFLGGESWFGRPITRGSLQSADDFGINFMDNSNSNFFRSTSSNNFLNQYLNGQLVFDDSQASQNLRLRAGESNNLVGGFGDGTRLTEKIIYTQYVDKYGARNDYAVTNVLERYGGEFANYNMNNFANGDSSQSASRRNLNTAVNFQNNRNSGSSATTQEDSQSSRSASFGQRAARGFNINLNRFF